MLSVRREMPKLPAVLFLATITLAELLFLSLFYKHGIDFECRANAPDAFCGFFSGMVVSVITLTAVGALFALFAPGDLRQLVSRIGESLWPLTMNLVGFLILLVPIGLLYEGTPRTNIVLTAGFWLAGSVFAVAGLLLYLAPFEKWAAFLRRRGGLLLPLLAIGLAAPFLSTLLREVWTIEALATRTFSAVGFLVGLLGYVVESYPAQRIIGAGDFYIDVARACSGIEGLALITIFVGLYLTLFRKDLAFPRAFLLFPIGLVVSALLNVVRIAVLLIIGLEGHPELAIGGFHSHAGWLMFTIVSLGLIWLAHSVSWFQRAEAVENPDSTTALPPFFADPVVARILPFLIFMASALLASAFSQNPSVLYPLRVACVGLAMWMFLPIYRQLDWKLDPAAVAVGAAVGLGWVLIPYDAEPDAMAPYGALTGAALLIWYLCRGFGTIVLVPMLEELFFRDYLLRILRFGDARTWMYFAVLVSTVAFAALHGRWLEAFVAGLAFAWLAQREGRIADAVIAHAIANAIVFFVALSTGQLHII